MIELRFFKAKRFFLGAVFIFFALLFNGALFAQDYNSFFERFYFGLSGGYSLNKLYMGGAEDFPYNSEWGSGHGWTASIPVRYHFTSWFALAAELTYIQKNYYYEMYAPPHQSNSEYTINHFVNMPVLAYFLIPLGSSGVRFLISGGGFLGFWAASHKKVQLQTLSVNSYSSSYNNAYEATEHYKFDKRKDNRFEAGLIGGAGFSYNWTHISLYLEGRYNYSLTNLNKNPKNNYYAPKMNDTITVNIGVIINLALFGL